MKITATERVGSIERTVTVEDEWQTAVTPEDAQGFSAVLFAPKQRTPEDFVSVKEFQARHVTVSNRFFDWMKHFVLDEDIRKKLTPEQKKEIDDCIREIEPDFKVMY